MPSLPFSAGIFLFEHRKFKSSRYPAFSDHPLKPCGIWERIAKSLAQTAGCLESHSQKNGNKLASQVEKIEHWFESFIIYSFMKKKTTCACHARGISRLSKIKQKILLSFHWQKQIHLKSPYKLIRITSFLFFPLVTAHNGNASAQLCLLLNPLYFLNNCNVCHCWIEFVSRKEANPFNTSHFAWFLCEKSFYSKYTFCMLLLSQE